jgi:hypothetical protein
MPKPGGDAGLFVCAPYVNFDNPWGRDGDVCSAFRISDPRNVIATVSISADPVTGGSGDGLRHTVRRRHPAIGIVDGAWGFSQAGEGDEARQIWEGVQ